MKTEKLNHKIFQVLSYLVKKEIDPKNTVTFFREIDCTVIENLRLEYSRQNQQKPSYTAFIIKAISQAMVEHPFVNARIFPGFPNSKIFKFPHIHTAVGIEKDQPGSEFFSFIDTIKHTDIKSIDGIQRELFDLSNATIENNSQMKSFIQIIKTYPVFLARKICVLPTYFPSLWMKYRGTSLIVSSPSKYGVDCVATSWHYPLGVSFGLVQKKPIVKNNEVEISLCFTLTLNWDRRLMVGAPAARFFNSIATNLMSKEFLQSQLELDIHDEVAKEKIIAMA